MRTRNASSGRSRNRVWTTDPRWRTLAPERRARIRRALSSRAEPSRHPQSVTLPRPSPKVVRVDCGARTRQDRDMLQLLMVVCRGLALTLGGHRELVLENLAVRQQQMA